ncbi:predicted protein [Naegleria gruberi]|uniref:Predicted protein n=1 Tax=Naegleria gruberi TaxID=5762 RepID=D2V9F7_NAEGR|nr:uncharacterized protein NAEGRDRAFT_65425 [Naegleria gruberi]EFC46583.1 predicted protein [Naegleria gruberi]|eukprot:XP_002679327.1 predicted protein [Naegleria gruberi strain NEG-M]
MSDNKRSTIHTHGGSSSNVASSYLKILNYNVNFVYATKSKLESNALFVFHALFRSEADVICLQETHAGYESAFKQIKWKDVRNLDQNLNGNLDEKFKEEQSLISLYPHYVFYNHGAAGGMAFLSKYEFLENSQITLATNAKDQYGKKVVDGSWFPMHLITVKVPEKTTGNVKQVLLVNVHLRPPLNDDGSASLWTARMTNVYRLNEIKYLYNYLEGIGIISFGNTTCPIVILGDYNEHDNDPSCEFLKLSNLFQDALNEFVPQNRETHRWPLKFVWGLYTYWWHKRLDHCVYSKQFFKCLDCKVIDGYEMNASDHQPVLTTLEFQTESHSNL